jgi:hypothetical protein
MALESFFIRVTNTTSGVLYLGDVSQGLDRESAARVRRPGPVYVPASGSVNLAMSSDVLLSLENGDIRQQVDAGNLTVSGVAGGVQVRTFRYDFSVDGGATGVYTLKSISGAAQTLGPCIAIRGWVDILTAPVSAGTPTGIIGSTADDNGFVTAVSNIETSWTANTIVPFNGAQVSNGNIELVTIGDQVAFANTKFTSATNVTFTLGGAALTAGKFDVHVEVLPLLN